MAKKINVSLKHVQIDKANTTAVISVAIAAFVLVFTLFAANALLNQRNYQSRVIDKKEIARDQLRENLDAAESLRASYESFVTTPSNIIGGASDGDGERDGDNARIILDALPSSYDFPALITSIEKILVAENVTINNIAGTDDELTQRDLLGDLPVEIPFSVGITGNYGSIQALVDSFERSIRPFNINRLSLRGDDESLRLELQVHSYFQPEKRFTVESEIVQ